MMFCKKCGSKNNLGDKFCATCGAVMSEDGLISENGGNNNVDQLNMANSSGTSGMQEINGTMNGKKNNNLIIIIVVVIVAVILGAGYYVIKFVNLVDEINDDMMQQESSQKELTKVELQKMSFSYDSSIWTSVASTNSNDSKGVRNQYSVVGLTYSESEYYATSYNFANTMKDYYVDQDYVILEDLEEITINGIEWYKLVVQDGEYISLQLFYSKGYDMYSFTYNSSPLMYYQELNNAKDVYNTLKYDNSDDLASQKAAKGKLLGEWNWGSFGYVVVENEKIYIYKDSSKDNNNVAYGTYIAYDKVATQASGYVEGIDIIIEVEKRYIDGVESSGGKLEYVLIPNSDGSYSLKSLVSGGTGTATKVK